MRFSYLKKDKQEKGQILLGLLALGLITFFVAPGIIDIAVKTGLFVVMLAIAIPGMLLGFLFNFAIDLSTWLMRYSMETPIISSSSWAYNIGWTFTRDLVNGLFIVILAFIGLTTVLRIKEYEVNKLLPKLIIVALLINFSPVLVGIIVDIFNILTNFFISNIDFGENLLGPQTFFLTQLGEAFTGIITSPGLQTQIGLVFGFLISLIYSLLGSLTFLMIALLYLFRTLAFWILLILAPLCFAAYILPATKKWWDMWWSQLIQWGMIGLTTAFFLYLSSHLLAGAEEIFKSKEFVEKIVAQGSVPTGYAGILTVILPFGTALVFMLIGIMLGLQTGAMGAKGIIGVARGAPKWIATRRPVQRRLGMGAGAAAKILSKGRETIERLPGGKIWGKALTAPTTVAEGALLRYATRARRFRVPQEFTEMSSSENTAYMAGLSPEERLAAGANMIQRNVLKYEPKAQAMMKEAVDQYADNPYYAKELGQWMDHAPGQVTKDIKKKFMMGVEGKSEAEVEKLFKDTKKEIQENVSGEDITIEMGLKFEYITREEAERAKTIQEKQALATKIQPKLTRDQRYQFLDNEAASAIHWRELKPGDMNTVLSASSKSLGVRVGMHRQISSILQAFQGAKEEDVVKELWDGPGGLNDIFDKFIESKNPAGGEALLDRIYDANPRLVHFFADTPSGHGWGWKGLQFMPKKDGGPDFHAYLTQRKKKPPGPGDTMIGIPSPFKQPSSTTPPGAAPPAGGPGVPPAGGPGVPPSPKTPPLKPTTPPTQREKEIRERAYRIWEEKGRPEQTKEGRDEDWFEAERQIREEESLEQRVATLLKQAESRASKKMYKGRMSTEQIDREVQNLESALSDLNNYYNQALSQNLSGKITDSLREVRTEVQGVKSWLQGKKFIQEKEDEAKERDLQALKDSVGALTDMYKRDRLSDEEIEKRLQKTLGKKVIERMREMEK